jgi:hypothetical protein
MKTTALMPVEEYLRLTEKPYCGYRDGVVSPKALGTKFHSIVQCDLLMLLQNAGHAGKELATARRGAGAVAQGSRGVPQAAGS